MSVEEELARLKCLAHQRTAVALPGAVLAASLLQEGQAGVVADCDFGQAACFVSLVVQQSLLVLVAVGIAQRC